MTVTEAVAGDERGVVAVLGDAYHDVLGCLDGLGESDAWLPTGCAGWAVRDLVYHMILDAQRALVALGTPKDVPADTDAVSYWRDWKPDTDRAETNLRMLRIVASVYPTFDRLRADYEETTRAAVYLAGQCALDRVVATQGHTLRVDDLIRTLIVEAGVHHLDLVVALNRSGPTETTLQFVRETLDGLLGSPVPLDWDDITYARVGTGRLELSAKDRDALGPLGDRFPLFG